MSRTTGVVLATGGLVIANETVFHSRPMDWRVPVATGLTAMAFTLAERAWPTGAELLAWTAFITVLFTRSKPNVPAPAESALTWWQKGS